MRDDGFLVFLLLALLAFVWWITRGKQMSAAATLYDAQHNINPFTGQTVDAIQPQEDYVTYQFTPIPLETLDLSGFSQPVGS